MATSPVSTTQPSIPATMISGAVWAPPTRQKWPAAEAVTITSQPWTSIRREQILLENMPVVRSVAHRIHARLPQHVELEDLVSAGAVGLIDAFHKFDGKKDVQFRTYAQIRIRGAILDSLRLLDWGPRALRHKAREMEAATHKLMQRFGRQPEESEVADELGMELAAYQSLVNAVKGLEIGSLHEARTDNPADEERVDIASSAEDDPLDRSMRSERAARLSAAVAELPEREQRVLEMYYVQEMTLKEIGVVLGVGEARVSQIHSAAIQELRVHFSCGREEFEGTACRCMAAS